MEKWKKDRSKFDGFEIQTNAYPKGEKVFIPYREEGVEYHFVDYVLVVYKEVRYWLQMRLIISSLGHYL